MEIFRGSRRGVASDWRDERIAELEGQVVARDEAARFCKVLQSLSSCQLPPQSSAQVHRRSLGTLGPFHKHREYCAVTHR